MGVVVSHSMPLGFFIAEMEVRRLYESVGMFAVVVTLVGVGLLSQLSSYRASVEEAVKDDKLTEQQARWRIRIINHWFPGVVIIGLWMLAVAALGIWQG